MTIKLPTTRAEPLRPVRRQLEPLPWPHAHEHAYAAMLLFAAKQTAGAVRSQLIVRLPQLVGRATRRMPHADADSDWLATLIAKLRREFGIAFKVARKWALEMLEGVSAQHARAFADAYGEVIAINPYVGRESWLPSAMRIAVDQNVALIQSIPDKLLDEVHTLVNAGTLGGQRVEEMALDILNRFGVTENRAILIARDQVGKFHGSLNRLRQVDAGVDSYRWSTSRDERVRPAHVRLEGTTHKWSEPPIVDPRKGRREHPGGDFQCRCSGIPLLPEFDDLEGQE